MSALRARRGQRFPGIIGVYSPESSYNNYAGNHGPWWIGGPIDTPARVLDQNQGIFYRSSSVRLAQVTDGLSQTIVFAERAHGLIDPTQSMWWYWWPNCGRDTMFQTWFGINPHHRFSGDLGAWATINSASSFHPGGAHVALLDGSVKFLKETIDTWPVDPQTGETGVYWDNVNQRVAFHPGTRFGVYQALSTRSWGEVINADAY